MSEKAPNQNVSDDEIDLLNFFNRVGRTLNRWSRAVGTAVLISIVFLLRRWFPLGISIALGVGASYLIKMTTESLFISDLIFRNNLARIDKLTNRDNSGTTSDLILKINKLHTFCLENNYIGLSDALSVSPDSVKNIIDISAFWIIDMSKDGVPDYVDYKNNHNVYDTNNIRMADRLDIRVKIESPQQLNYVRNGILKFISSDSLFQQRNRVRILQNRDMLSRLNYDILQLDSLQKVKYFEETRNRQPQSGGQMIFLQEQNTQLLYNDIYNLYEKKQLLESERDLYNGIITVLSDFSTPAKRDNGALYYGKYVIPILFTITLLILIIISNRKKLENIFKNY